MAASAFTSLTRAQIQCVDLALTSEDGKASTTALQIICLAENWAMFPFYKPWKHEKTLRNVLKN